MTKNDDKRVPALRFKGFNDDWAQRKLKNLVSFSKGKGYTKNDLLSNGTPILLYGMLYTNYLERYSNFFTYAKANLKSVYSTKHEVVMPDSGETSVDIARASWVDKPGVILGGGLIILKPKDIIFPGFLAYSLTYGKNHKDIASKAQGKSVVHIHSKDLANLKFFFPKNIVTQRKICNLLEEVNTYISLQQRKLQQLKLLKKAMLQDLFADKAVPKLRFRGFKDYWVPKKLGDIANFINGRAYRQNELLDKGKYKVLRVGNFYTNDSWYFSNLELKPQYYINKGDLVYTWSATFGPHIWRGEKVIYHYHIWKINLSKSLNKKFVFYLLEADKAKLLSNTNGSTMIHITKRNMESKTVLIPNTIEQSQIRNSLDNVSNLITFQQEKIAEVKQIKQFLLQNMFI